MGLGVGVGLVLLDKECMQVPAPVPAFGRDLVPARGCVMSFESLPTRRGSTETLARGLALASGPLVEMLQPKQEPMDEEEAALQEEMKVCLQSSIPYGIQTFSHGVTQKS